MTTLGCWQKESPAVDMNSAPSTQVATDFNCNATEYWKAVRKRPVGVVRIALDLTHWARVFSALAMNWPLNSCNHLDGINQVTTRRCAELVCRPLLNIMCRLLLFLNPPTIRVIFRNVRLTRLLQKMVLEIVQNNLQTCSCSSHPHSFFSSGHGLLADNV